MVSGAVPVFVARNLCEAFWPSSRLPKSWWVLSKDMAGAGAWACVRMPNIIMAMAPRAGCSPASSRDIGVGADHGDGRNARLATVSARDASGMPKSAFGRRRRPRKPDIRLPSRNAC